MTLKTTVSKRTYQTSVFHPNVGKENPPLHPPRRKQKARRTFSKYMDLLY